MKSSIQSLLLALAILGTATAALAQDSQDLEQPVFPQDPFRFTERHVWIGESTLDARSNFWDDNFRNFKASRGGLAGLAFGGDYIQHLDRHNALMLSAGLSFTSIKEPARHVLDEDGNPLEHHLDLYSLSLTAGYLFYPTGTEQAVIPYLGAGAGIYAGTLRSYRSSFTTTTDDCDEDGNNCTTTTTFVDKEESSFLTVGYFALAGLEVPVTSHTALLVEGRYTVAHAHLGGDFADNRSLDLSGGQYTAGVAIHF
ncbi:MAG: outer membrane protein [Thermoanaerobaculia bacterium]